MAPLIPSAKLTLSYPLYACDFDPLDSSRLVVGGGGGAGRTGVGNKITLLDVSNANELHETAEIELSKDEDNVTSLAVGAKTNKATPIFAGVNSSPSDVAQGLNRHFRILMVEPNSKKSKGDEKVATQNISELSRTTLFQGKEKDSYQRITRLSRPYPGLPQLGAVATGLAKSSEIEVFETFTIAPVVPRGALTNSKEAEDVDIIQTGDTEYIFAYCDEHDIYIKRISSEPDTEAPECIYITPATRSAEKPTTPKFRAMRFLSKDLLVMLTNIHGNGGVVLQIFRIPPSGKGQCRLAQSLRLPERITKATGLAVCNLTPPITPSEEQTYTQFVIAVAGHDISLNLFKVDFQAAAGISVVSSIKSFRTFRNVHPLQITSLAFSSFTPPTNPITANTPPQYLKLASVGVANTVVVHTFPLFPVPLSMKRGQSITPRYVIALPSTAAAYGMGIVVSFIGIALAAVFIQSLLEIRGGSPDYLGMKNYVPIQWQHAIGGTHLGPSYHASISKPTSISTPVSTFTPPENVEPTSIESLEPTETSEPESIPSSENSDKERDDKTAQDILIQKLNAVVNREPEATEKQEAAEEKGKRKTWEELTHHEKDHWKKALQEAGEWAEGLPENLLKGVLFGEIGAAVGRAAAGM